MAVVLRDYQDDAVVDVRVAYRNGYRAVILVLSTGAGKTVIFSYIAKSAAEKGKKVLILAHRDQLIKQASRKLHDYDVPHGIIMARFTPNHRANVQVASVQTLVRRLDKTKMWFEPDIIVVDEAHLSAANSYRKVLAAFPNALILGVTGSPCRLDNKPLGKEYGGIYDLMIEGIPIGELQNRGFLVRTKVFAPAEQLDLSGVDTSKGDYDVTQLAAVVDKPKITGDAVAHYQRICPNAPAIAWCVTIEHAQHVAEEFRRHGIKAIMLCGDDETDIRDNALRGLETGEVQVICFVGILIEGVDCAAIACVISLRPTMSLSSYLQVIGRELRTIYEPGMPIDTDEERLAAIAASVKPCAYFLDHSGLTFRHGMIDEDRGWSLEWGERKKGKKKKVAEKPVDVVQCKSCYAVFSPQPACPFCGKPVEVKTRKLDHVDGELQEITPEMAAQMKRKKKHEVKGAKTLDELHKIAAERGYNPNWAKHTFEARKRISEKWRPPPPPPPPSLEELKVMPLDQLVIVQNQQGYPSNWAADFYYSQQAFGG
jgi:superfamily II DNA or RNA helicase